MTRPVRLTGGVIIAWLILCAMLFCSAEPPPDVTQFQPAQDDSPRSGDGD